MTQEVALDTSDETSTALIPLPFQEAIEWMQERVPLLKADWEALEEKARRKAFTVAGVAQLDIVRDVWKALDKALAKGTSLEEFKRDVGEKLQKEWQGTVKDPGSRLETIFRTNAQLAYAAGRYRQATAPEVARVRPYWQYSSVLDGRTSSVCKRLNGTVRPVDDPFWEGRHPPAHFRCRSALISLRTSQAKAMGITENPPTVKADEGFGGTPGEDEWKPKAADYPPELWAAYREKQARL